MLFVKPQESVVTANAMMPPSREHAGGGGGNVPAAVSFGNFFDFFVTGPASGASILKGRVRFNRRCSAMDDDALIISTSLLESARKGDEKATASLVTVIYPLIGRVVRNQVRRRDDVEDVIQEVILKILLKLHQYRGPQPFSHWVSRLAITTSYDWLRKQKARPAITGADLSDSERELLERTLHGSDGFVDGTQHDLLLGLLDRLLTSLHPREQVVIRLLDLEERSVREIAELTGWSESKIKVTAHRSRKKLAERLKQLEPSHGNS